MFPRNRKNPGDLPPCPNPNMNVGSVFGGQVTNLIFDYLFIKLFLNNSLITVIGLEFTEGGLNNQSENMHTGILINHHPPFGHCITPYSTCPAELLDLTPHFGYTPIMTSD